MSDLNRLWRMLERNATPAEYAAASANILAIKHERLAVDDALIEQVWEAIGGADYIRASDRDAEWLFVSKTLHLLAGGTP